MNEDVSEVPKELIGKGRMWMDLYERHPHTLRVHVLLYCPYTHSPRTAQPFIVLQQQTALFPWLQLSFLLP